MCCTARGCSQPLIFLPYPTRFHSAACSQLVLVSVCVQRVMQRAYVQPYSFICVQPRPVALVSAFAHHLRAAVARGAGLGVSSAWQLTHAACIYAFACKQHATSSDTELSRQLDIRAAKALASQSYSV